MIHAGTWTFIDKVSGGSTKIIINDATPSKVVSAFASAATTLSVTDNSKLFGYDPAGHETRYTSSSLKKKTTG